MRSRLLLASALLILCTASLCHAQAKPSPDAHPDPLKQLNFRYIGPPGNRVSAVIGELGNPNVYYAGAASGGVWKSEDGGDHWFPVFDKQTAQSIGSLAIAPSSHN